MKCFVLLAVALTITAAHAQDAGDQGAVDGVAGAQVGTAADAPDEVHVQAPTTEVPAADLATATNTIRQAWNDFTGCRRPSACKAYFESFGVALSFSDGTIAPFAHTQRLSATSRDCIKKARAFLEQGNRSMAVQWAMASRIDNISERDWLGSHPEAVLEALKRCCW